MNTTKQINFSVFEEIEKFVKQFPRIWNCDDRLQRLTQGKRDTLRNVAEAYYEKNCENVPSITDLEVYYKNVNSQLFNYLCNEIVIETEIDKHKGFSLDENGHFSKFHDTDVGRTFKLLFKAPLKITGISKTSAGDKNLYNIEFEWLYQNDVKETAEFVRFIASSLNLGSSAKQGFAQFIYELIVKAESLDMINVQPDTIGVDENGKILVNIDSSGIDMKKNITLIRKFHDQSSNPRAFRMLFAMNSIAPLFIEIKRRTSGGFIFPLPVLCGETGAAKTSTAAIFTVIGFNQTKNEGMAALETIKTNFTFTNALSRNVLPLIINDVDNLWFTHMASIIKNLSEHAEFFGRGRPDLTTVIKEARRLPILTSNEIIAPSDDAAASRRYVIELFDQRNVERRNDEAYNDFLSKIEPGFMYAVIDKLYGGRDINAIIGEIQGAKNSAQFVQTILNRINDLCVEYGIPPFPPYDGNDAIESGSLFADDDFLALAEYVISEYRKLESTDQWGNRRYSDLTLGEIDVDSIDETTIVWLTGSAYRKVQRRLNLKYSRITQLFSNYVSNLRYGIHASNKFHKFAGYPGRGFALWIRNEEGGR